MKPWSTEVQFHRRQELAAFIRRKFRPLLDDQARSQQLLWWDQARVALWAANAFFLGDTPGAWTREVTEPTSRASGKLTFQVR